MKRAANYSTGARYSKKRQREGGIVLVLALVLLVIISMVAIMAVKGSISGEQVSNNIRINTVATQAAETALRYCENQVLNGNPDGLIVNPLPLGESEGMPTLWATRANWAALANTATADVTNSADAAARALGTLPRCMIETYPLRTLQDGPKRDSYLITARGFSPDYAVDGGGQVTSGGEVWLQSILRY